MPAAARLAPQGAPLPELFSPKGHAVGRLIRYIYNSLTNQGPRTAGKKVHFSQRAAIANQRPMAPYSFCELARNAERHSHVAFVFHLKKTQMKIEHIAIWTLNLEKMKSFYLNFFDLKSNEKYYNPKKKFSSYFLSFENGPRIELMHRPDISEFIEKKDSKLGLTHFAISVGSKEKVDLITESVRKNGFNIIGEPRITGDGYYESVISDPEGNLIEITE